MRKQVELTGPEALRPAASPVNSFVQPAQGNASELIAALAPLSSKLSSIYLKHQESQREEQEALAERKIGGMTFEESRQAIKDGALAEFSSPWFRAAFKKQHGLRMANEVRRKAEADLATVDMSEVNPEEFVAKYVREAEQDIPPGDKFMSSGFTQGLNGVTDTVRSKVNEDRIKRTVEVRNDNAYQNFLGEIEWAASEIADPAAVLGLVRDRYKSNRDLLNISYRDQDKIIGEVLKTLAQRPGMEKYVEELGKLDRDGVALSTKLGSGFAALKASAEATTQRHQTDAIQGDLAGFIQAADKGELDVDTFNTWVGGNRAVVSGSTEASILTRNLDAQERAKAKALAALQDTAKEAYLAQMSPQLVELARTGKIAEIAQDLSGNIFGKDVQVTSKEAKEFALNQAAVQIASEGQAQGLTPEVIRSRQIEMYGLNGEIDPQVNSRISALLNSTISGGDLSPTVLDYLPELQRANAVAPHMIDRIATSEADRLFLDTIFVGMDYGQDAATAVKNATWRRDNRDRITLPSGKDRKSMLDGVVKELDGRGSIFGMGGWDISQRALLDKTIGERVEYFYATGAQGKDLTKRVVESFERSHAYMNGRLVDITGTGMPASRTLPIFQESVDAIKEAKPAYAKEDLTFLPMSRGSDRFQAVTATGIPIAGTERTWAEMSGLYETRKQERLLKRGEQVRNLPKAIEQQVREQGFGVVPTI